MAKRKRIKAWHTPGQTRNRDEYRANIRSAVAQYLEKEQIATVGQIAVSIGLSTHQTTGALTELLRQGVVLRTRPGVYSDTSDVQPDM